MQKRNEDLRQDRKRLFDRKDVKGSGSELHLKDASPELIESIKAEMAAEKRKQNMKGIVILIAAVAAVVAFLAFPSKQESKVMEPRAIVAEDSRNMEPLLRGQAALEQRKWEAAERYFRKMLGYPPAKMEATYYLAKMYCMRCQEENVGCDQAKSMVESNIDNQWHDYKSLQGMLSGK